MDQQDDKVTPRSIRDYVDNFTLRHGKLILAAVKSQREIKYDGYLRKRYTKYETIILINEDFN